MIEMRDVSKSFVIKEKRNGIFKRSNKVEKTVISDLNLKIPKGKIVGLLGMNGAGKTTTIKMLSTLLLPTTGYIYLDGKNILENQNEIKNKVNLISGGEKNLFWRLTGRENLEYFASLYGIDRKETKQIIKEILEIVKLESAADVVVEKYSKGMKQRLQIAKGLINNPDYLFLDEPTLGLDVLIAKELREYILKLAKIENKGILLTSHYLHEVEELCDYIYILEEGQVKNEGTANQIISKLNKVIKTQIRFEQRIPELYDNILSFSMVNNVNWIEEGTLEIISSEEIVPNILEIIGISNFKKIISITSIKPTLEDCLISEWEEKLEL